MFSTKEWKNSFEVKEEGGGVEDRLLLLLPL